MGPSLYVALWLIPAWCIWHKDWPVWSVAPFGVMWLIIGACLVRLICPNPYPTYTAHYLDRPVTAITRPVHVYEEEPTIPLLNAPED